MHRAIAVAVALSLFTGSLLGLAPSAEAGLDDRLPADDPSWPLRDRPWDDVVDGYAIVGGLAGVLAVMTFAAERVKERPRRSLGDPLDGSLRREPRGVMELGGCY